MQSLLRSTLLLGIALGLALPNPGIAQAGDRPEQWYFWTDDGVMHYAFEMGSAQHPGDTIVVLHGGWGAEHSYLVRPLAPLASDYRFVFYDQRGSLRSPAPDSTIRIARMVADLDHLREQLGLEQMTLLAHSMGGALAYAYLSAHPERVRGLVLVAAVPPAPFSNEPPMALLEEIWPDVDVDALQAETEELRQGWDARTLEIIDREGIIPEGARHLPSGSRELAAAVSDRVRTRTWRINFTVVNTCDASRWREMDGGMVYYNQNVPNQLMQPEGGYAEWADRFWPNLRGFSGPVHAVIGTCDFVDVGPAIWPRVVDHLPNGRLHRVEDSGHAIWMDRPEAFTSAVRTSLEEIRSGSPGGPGGG